MSNTTENQAKKADHAPIDASEFHLILDVSAVAVSTDYYAGKPDLRPSEAIAAIRRFDLSAFPWCPTDGKAYRIFLTRYMPPSVLTSIMKLDDADFEGVMGAWKPDSEWREDFAQMLLHVRRGALLAYETILKIEDQESKNEVRREARKRVRKLAGEADAEEPSKTGAMNRKARAIH